MLRDIWCHHHRSETRTADVLINDYSGLPIPIITKSFNKFYGVIKKTDSVLLPPGEVETTTRRGQRSFFSEWWEKRWRTDSVEDSKVYVELESVVV